MNKKNARKRIDKIEAVYIINETIQAKLLPKTKDVFPGWKGTLGASSTSLKDPAPLALYISNLRAVITLHMAHYGQLWAELILSQYLTLSKIPQTQSMSTISKWIGRWIYSGVIESWRTKDYHPWSSHRGAVVNEFD